MTQSLPTREWLDFLESEYLSSFIPAGGASIKFAVSLDTEADEQLIRELERRSTSLGYVVANLDAARTRIHMIDQVFFAISEHVPWRDTVRRVVESLAGEAGYLPAEAGEGPYFQRLAEASGLDPQFVLLDMRKKVERGVFKNRRLAKDFRVAMTQLAEAELVGGPEGATTFEVLTDWLTGRNRAVSAVKPYQIFSRITRANARYLFESLCVWLGIARYAGLALVLDVRRLSIARNPRDELIY